MDKIKSISCALVVVFLSMISSCKTNKQPKKPQNPTLSSENTPQPLAEIPVKESQKCPLDETSQPGSQKSTEPIAFSKLSFRVDSSLGFQLAASEIQDKKIDLVSNCKGSAKLALSEQANSNQGCNPRYFALWGSDQPCAKADLYPESQRQVWNFYNDETLTFFFNRHSVTDRERKSTPLHNRSGLTQVKSLPIAEQEELRRLMVPGSKYSYLRQPRDLLALDIVALPKYPIVQLLAGERKVVDRCTQCKAFSAHKPRFELKIDEVAYQVNMLLKHNRNQALKIVLLGNPIHQKEAPTIKIELSVCSNGRVQTEACEDLPILKYRFVDEWNALVVRYINETNDSDKNHAVLQGHGNLVLDFPSKFFFITEKAAGKSEAELKAITTVKHHPILIKDAPACDLYFNAQSAVSMDLGSVWYAFDPDHNALVVHANLQKQGQEETDLEQFRSVVVQRKGVGFRSCLALDFSRQFKKELAEKFHLAPSNDSDSSCEFPSQGDPSMSSIGNVVIMKKCYLSLKKEEGIFRIKLSEIIGFPPSLTQAVQIYRRFGDEMIHRLSDFEVQALFEPMVFGDKRQFLLSLRRSERSDFYNLGRAFVLKKKGSNPNLDCLYGEDNIQHNEFSPPYNDIPHDKGLLMRAIGFHSYGRNFLLYHGITKDGEEYKTFLLDLSQTNCKPKSISELKGKKLLSLVSKCGKVEVYTDKLEKEYPSLQSLDRYLKTGERQILSFNPQKNDYEIKTEYAKSSQSFEIPLLSQEACQNL